MDVYADLFDEDLDGVAANLDGGIRSAARPLRTGRREIVSQRSHKSSSSWCSSGGAKGSNPRSLLQKQLGKYPLVDSGVVTRPVLGICADALRDATALAPVEPWSLGYELAGRRLARFGQSHSCRSQWRTRRSRHAAFLTVSAIKSRFVHKFVHKPTGRVDSVG